MHIVLIRFSSLGDVILQSPLIAWIKSQFPKSKITFITSREFRPLVSGHEYIDEVITIERLKGFEDIKQIHNLAKNIKELKPDLIIDLHGTLRAKLIHLFSFNTPFIRTDKRSILRFILIRLKLDFLKNMESHHERVINDFKFIFKRDFDIDRTIQFNINQTKNPLIGLTTLPQSFSSVKSLVDGEYIAISPIASFESKRWPMQYVRDLINLILKDDELSKYKIVIVAGPADTYCDEIFNEELKKENRIVNLQGKTTIEESSLVLAKAKICVSNDTGTGHITEAFGNPVITLFGPTSESFGFRPHLDDSCAMSTKLSCRPCSGTGKNNCKREKHFCMLELKAEAVFGQLKVILKRRES